MGRKSGKRARPEHLGRLIDAGKATQFKPGNEYRFARGESGNPGGRPKAIGEAYKERIARPVTDPKKQAAFELMTGERVDPKNPPTHAELLAARAVHSATTGRDAHRYLRELREATEGSQHELSGRVAFLLSLDGLPRTDAVKHSGDQAQAET